MTRMRAQSLCSRAMRALAALPVGQPLSRDELAAELAHPSATLRQALSVAIDKGFIDSSGRAYRGQAHYHLTEAGRRYLSLPLANPAKAAQASKCEAPTEDQLFAPMSPPVPPNYALASVFRWGSQQASLRIAIAATAPQARGRRAPLI